LGDGPPLGGPSCRGLHPMMPPNGATS